ncbi:MAG: hypothetical protein OEW98_09250 [Betaproteobacteria bacterium]|nr:hypothetical protein [Betaproteobacteria bacterium]
MRALHSSFILALALACTACGTTGAGVDGSEPDPVLIAQEEDAVAAGIAAAPPPQSIEGDLPQAAAAATPPAATPAGKALEEVIVEAPRPRSEVIMDLVSQARAVLQPVELKYVFTGKGRREVLRGRPVAFALWSEKAKEWTIAEIEIPRPPIKWRPGRGPLPFRLLTPGLSARHEKGTGAERLMFSFTRDGEPLKVYGRKFPVFDNTLVQRRKWREVARTATPIVYLPSNEDTIDPQFASGGREFLLGTAQRAIDELRALSVPSAAYPGQLLADVVPATVIASLAIIEQTDDSDFRAKGTAAFEDVMSHYGFKGQEAYRYSVSTARALGPMQFTNSRGNGTYAMVARRCRAAQIDPNFERGATNLLNAMKAAICLFDIELKQMRPEIRWPYRNNPAVLGIFPVAAYNGGPRNVTRLYGVMKRAGVQPENLRAPGQQPPGAGVTCPCFWTEDFGGVRPVPIPRYNNENRWYVEKYQTLLQLLEQPS